MEREQARDLGTLSRLPALCRAVPNVVGSLHWAGEESHG